MSSATAAELAQVDNREAHREGLTVIQMSRGEPLRECVRTAVRVYLRNMDGQEVQGLHRLVMDEVERPLIETVLESTNNNQSVTARILGISRSTLRKKLACYAETPQTKG
ncbi:MAG: Fis family transcriptional regulator [Thiohalocapsa sp.]|jgi:Fis family transcriptional regulator|uniref:helix-turn-helix domain-containing protein n=1 Tax=Thiohalocapsa sp. TaxID=2497641 RepID=UPI0025D14E3C|nr:helix-turn-helix domain-containing protein [Thiohalocapsa sp.]MCG6941543.1 Fis family transcriptional regulator [Thiohalocapsa sp.]